MGNEGNRLFQEILAQIDANYEKGLIEQYKALETIYLKCYNKYLEEKQAKQSAKVEQEINDTSKQGMISQKTNETEPSTSFFGEIYEPAYNRMMQEQKTPKFQIQGHRTIVASDIHGDIEDFLKILLENDLIILENSYQLVDLKTLKSYDTFASFKREMEKKRNDKIFSDAECVILPKFELNKDIDITFNYLGDLIDEGRFSIECFYMMMMLMEKAKSCNNFKINYIAGNHEIANIILETKSIKDHYLRQCTKYYYCGDDKSKYLARNSNSGKTISEKSHNFQMGCVAEHSKKLIENGQMKLAYVDGNNVFIHANPSVDFVLSFLNIGRTKNEIEKIINNTIYDEQSEFLGKSEEERREYYLEQLKKLNEFFVEEVKENNLCKFNFDNEFLTYIGDCFDDDGRNKEAYCGPTFLPNFVYFVGHDSRAEWEYTFNSSELYCLDGHNKGIHRFANIINDVVYCGSVKSNEFQREYLQQQINSLYSKIAEKHKQNGLNERITKETIYTEGEGLLENFENAYVEMPGDKSLEVQNIDSMLENAYAEMPGDKSSCICVVNGSRCSAM